MNFSTHYFNYRVETRIRRLHRKLNKKDDHKLNERNARFQDIRMHTVYARFSAGKSLKKPGVIVCFMYRCKLVTNVLEH